MTIIRTMLAATSGDVDLAHETASVRRAMRRAAEVLDRGMPVTMTSAWNTESPWGRLTIQYEGSDGEDLPLPLVLAFDVEGAESPVANRWMDGDGREALVMAEACLDAPSPGVPHGDADEADLVATGLAWSLVEGETDAATIHRATPWSRARILVGVPDPTKPAMPGTGRPRMTWRERRDLPAAGVEALAAMRPGTLVRPRDATARMEPIVTRLSQRWADPVGRMRALAAWSAFEASRR